MSPESTLNGYTGCLSQTGGCLGPNDPLFLDLHNSYHGDVG
jgi:hypothetical protein